MKRSEMRMWEGTKSHEIAKSNRRCQSVGPFSSLTPHQSSLARRLLVTYFHISIDIKCQWDVYCTFRSILTITISWHQKQNKDIKTRHKATVFIVQNWCSANKNADIGTNTNHFGASSSPMQSLLFALALWKCFVFLLCLRLAALPPVA